MEAHREPGVRRALVLLLPAALFLGGLAGAARGETPGEPTSKGRTAAEWIEVLDGETGTAVAVGALKEIGAPARPLLLSALEDSPSPKVREGVARALGGVGGPGVAEALAAAIRRERQRSKGHSTRSVSRHRAGETRSVRRW